MFFYRELSALADQFFSNVSLLLRGKKGDYFQTVSLLDDSNNNFAITRYGNTSVSLSNYKYGNSSLAFDGDGDFLRVQNNIVFDLGAGDFTIESWIYLNVMPGDGYPNAFWICGWGPENSNPGFDFYLSSTNIGLNLTDFTSPTAIGAHNMTTNQWYHVAAVRNGTSFKLFVNGIEKASGTSSASATAPTSNGIAICAAEPAGATGGNLNGNIDDFRITKGVARYTANFTPPQSELTLVGDANAENVSVLIRGNRTTQTIANSILDDSSNKHGVTSYGNVDISTSEYKYGPSSLVFDGNGDYLTVPLSNTLDFRSGDFTIETWFKVTQFKGYQAIYSRPKTTADGSGMVLFFDPSNNIVFIAGNSGWSVVIGTAPPTINVWNHVAVTRSGNVFRFWLNGQLMDSTTNSINFDISTEPAYIGRHPYFPSFNSSQDFSGFIDDFRITKGVARYTANFTPPDAELPNS